MRFRKFPVQVLGEVPEGYGADTKRLLNVFFFAAATHLWRDFSLYKWLHKLGVETTTYYNHI